VEVKLEEALFNLVKRCVTSLPADVKEALMKASREEEGLARSQLEAVLRNVEAAEEEELPICQDTGLLSFYVNLDPSRYAPLELMEAAVRAVRRATREVPLRPNVVHPLTRVNTGDNVGAGQPLFEWSFNDRGLLEVTVAARGAGSENVAKLAMLPPSAGLEGLIDFTLSAVVEARGLPCPPGIVGVGVGGSADEALKLAKRALLRPIGLHGVGELAELEAELLDKVNRLGIGPMGLGGRHTALAVHVECAHTHTACLPVAVAFSCWAVRRATLRLGP
jgi:tartrate/fumarate subfamily iron-sulfur-dependent hydro-lyase alpha chain